MRVTRNILLVGSFKFSLQLSDLLLELMIELALMAELL
jgi:hypothetical protein